MQSPAVLYSYLENVVKCTKSISDDNCRKLNPRLMSLFLQQVYLKTSKEEPSYTKILCLNDTRLTGYGDI